MGRRFGADRVGTRAPVASMAKPPRMLEDTRIMAAITSIVQRSEKQTDEQRLRASYVDAGIKPLLESVNNQIVYGRRGTGKTHLLKVLQESDYFRKRNGCVVYIDARTLGSTEQFSDSSIPLPQRCFVLFQDINNIVWQYLQQFIYNNEVPDLVKAELALQDIIRIVAEPLHRYEKRIQRTGAKATAENSAKLQFDFGTSKGNASGGLASKTSAEQTVEEEYAVTRTDKIVFPELQAAMRRLLEAAGAHLVLLIDEWQQIPKDLQPYLAEFLKRAFFPINRITIIIAALEYRSAFSIHNDHDQLIGFELGADISASLDIDDFYVFDKGRTTIANIYEEVLYRHLETELGDYLSTKYAVVDAASLLDKMFSSRETFEELARACEGVIRDLINIFEKAALNARSRGRTSIDRTAVTAAARDWFETDKAKGLRDDSRLLLDRIIDEVISNKKSRTFMLRRDQEKRDPIQRLFDARVLHLVLKGYADKDNPGVKYNIYTIDYGTYVDLLNTSRAPEDFGEDLEAQETIVPFDDKRKIRRIMLRPELLDEFDPIQP
jgi:hypothetical protein